MRLKQKTKSYLIP